MRSEKNDFTQGSILKKLSWFMLPVLGALVLQAAYGAVDLLVVGRFGTTTGLSGVSTGSQVLNLVTFVVTQLAMGITVLIARYLGEKRPQYIGQVIAGKTYHSRLLVGTGKYKDFAETRAAIDASGAEIVTVAIRRVNIGQNPGEPNLLDALPPSQFTILPNTAGCYTADDAIRTLRLGRELLDGHPLCKLEVLGDPTNLFPNMPETLKAAEILVKDGFQVMVYCADDPIQAKMLEDIGCVAVMPLASLIGSGMGIVNPWNLRLIIDSLKVPVLVDAGVGTASDATVAMELGCDGVLMNTAIAHAKNPVLMASAMKKAVEAGREAFLAGRMPRKYYSADPSSPTTGLIGS